MVLAILLVLPLIVLVAGARRLVRRTGAPRHSDVPTRPDAPTWIVAVAADRLPADRREWGNAMAAELTGIPAGSRRWRFALGAAWVALFPPQRRPAIPALVAVAGLIVVVAATLAVHTWLPTMQAFVAEAGVLLSGYAVLAVARQARVHRGRVRLAISAAMLLGVAGIVTIVSFVAVTHPTATDDPSHVFGVLLAVLVTGYVALALTPPRASTSDAVALRWGAGAALGCGLAWAIPAVTQRPAWFDGMHPYSFLAAYAAVLAAAIAAAASRRSLRAGVQVGLWAGLLGALLFFAVGMLATLTIRPGTLTDPYDIAAYPLSGAPDVASYLISDLLGGSIMMLLLFPLATVTVGIIGGALGVNLRGRPVAGHLTPR